MTSVEALREFRRAVERFGQEVNGALSEMDGNAQRMLSWLSHDQMPYWQSQIRQRQEKIARARSDLLRKQLSSSQDDPSCVDERKALERAKQRVEEAMEKVKAVKKWSITVDREFTLYKGAASSMAETHQRDVPMISMRLAEMVKRLEEYALIGTNVPAPGMVARSEGQEEAELSADAMNESAEGNRGDEKLLAVERQDPFLSLLRLCPSAAARRAAPRDERLVREWTINHDQLPGKGTSPAMGEHEVDTLRSFHAGEPAETDVVTLAPGVLDGRDLFLTRFAPAFEGDSGWFVGGVEWLATGDSSAGLVGVSSRWLWQQRPWMREAMRLPIGYLYVVIAGTLAGVLDEEGVRVVGPDGGGA